MRLLLTLLLAAAGNGCSLLRSRYAMDDPVYAAKYADGAPKSDPLGKAKQALDARHTGGLAGAYASGGVQVIPGSEVVRGGGELGIEAYATSWQTGRLALAGFIGADDGYSGLDCGLRVQTPTRIAPFVGAGTFHGYSSDDENWSIDESGENVEGYDGWLSTVYPELGGHLWIDGRWRLTAYGRYVVSSEGRRYDDWLLGGQLTVFHR